MQRVHQAAAAEPSEPGRYRVARDSRGHSPAQAAAARAFATRLRQVAGMTLGGLTGAPACAPFRVHRRLSCITAERSALMRPRVTTAAAAFAALALAACSAAGPARPAAGPGGPRPGARAGQAEPRTVAAVRADTGDYLTLDSAGQFTVTYQMLSPAARRAISERAWIAVHRGCPGLLYRIGRVRVAGSTAWVTVSPPGSARTGRMMTETLSYAGGHWSISPDLSAYQQARRAMDAALRARGCPG